MKKISALLFVCCFCVLSLYGCSSNSMELYLDDSPYTANQVEIDITAMTQKNYGTDTYRLSLNFTITNHNPDISSYYFEGGEIVREKDGAKYAIGSLPCSHYVAFAVGCDVQTTRDGQATIPTSLEDDKYMFTYTYEGTKFTIHLYNSNN